MYAVSYNTLSCHSRQQRQCQPKLAWGTGLRYLLDLKCLSRGFISFLIVPTKVEERENPFGNVLEVSEGLEVAIRNQPTRLCLLTR